MNLFSKSINTVFYRMWHFFINTYYKHVPDINFKRVKHELQYNTFKSFLRQIIYTLYFSVNLVSVYIYFINTEGSYFNLRNMNLF